MTGYTVHTGSNEKFTEGWDAIFGKGGVAKGKSKAAATRSKPAAKKKNKKK